MPKLIVVEKQQPRDGRPHARYEEGHKPNEPHVVTKRRHAPWLIPRPAQRGAERRPHEHQHACHTGQKHQQRKVIERRR